MKLVLTLCILIMGQNSFAASAGDLDGPVVTPKPAVKQPSVGKRPAADEDDDEDVKPKFKLCNEKGGETDNIDTVKGMFNHILGVPGNLPFTLKSEVKTKFGTATVIARALPNTKTASIHIQLPESIGEIPASALFCKLSETAIMVKSVTSWGNFNFVLKKESPTRIQVRETSGQMEGQFSIRAAK